MAVAEKCGHDKRGKSIFRDDGTFDDDLPEIAKAYRKFREENNVRFESLS